MSRDRCCVSGCFESGRSHPVLHGFPNPEKYPERFREWVYAVGGDILGLSNNYIYKHRRVCHGHYDTKYCCRFNRISNIAVPTINMPRTDSVPHFTIVERPPLKAIKNLMLDSPSTSKDAMPYEGDSSSYNLNINIDNPEVYCNKDTEKENNMMYQTGGSLEQPNQSLNAVEVKDNLDVKLIHGEKGRNKPHSSYEKSPQPSKKLTRRVIMTSSEKMLHKKLVAVKVKLSKCRSQVKKQKVELKTARNLFSNHKLVNIMESWTTSAKMLTLMQFREYKKKEKGRRFSNQEKIIALTIFKHSPKAYRFLRKIFILPSSQTLTKLIHKCSLKPGINNNIFSQLKKKGDKMKQEHRLCALLFDEMQLKASISYNERKDRVSGFVSDGQDTKKVLADHAQVFMIRGLIKNYKQPIAYTFSAGATKGVELAKQIKEIIKELQQAGFNVIATVCDQGTNNRQAIRLLKEETRREYLQQGGTENLNENIFKINDYEVVPLYDPPHLLKGIRNNLLTKDLHYKVGQISGVAKWSHLQLLYQENPGYKNMRLIPSLTDNHVVPAKIGKMKVKYASQVFSRTVSSNMGYLAGKGILPTECSETADLFLFMDNLFDSVNGSFSSKKYAKPLLGAVTPSSPHKEKWKEAVKAFSNMHFQKNGKNETVPTIQGWISTLKGIQDLISKLERDYNITSFWMRHLNQDSLENFFGAIRSHGCRNTNPTAEQFESAFATLLINNLVSVHAPGTNCENDKSEMLSKFILDEGCEANETTCEVDLNDLVEIEVTPFEDKSDPRIMAPLEYVSGYFIKVSKNKIWKGCQICKKCLIQDQQRDYIRQREYAGRNWLQNPNDAFVKTLSNIQDILDFCLKKYIEKPCLKEIIKTIICTVIQFDFLSCSKHKEILKKFLINKTTRFFIYTYCKNINKIICGKRGVDDENDMLQQLSKIYFNKHRKKK